MTKSNKAMTQRRALTLETGNFEGSLLGEVHKGNRAPKTPPGFSRLNDIPPELSGWLTETACETFMMMVNAGFTFQQALTAVYLSGLENAVSANKEDEQGDEYIINLD